MGDSRVIAWFSCGAASAVAAKYAIEKYGERVCIVYCDTMKSEHPDNLRFFEDVQRWLKREIIVIKSEKYASVEDVFQARRYMAGIAGAPCTTEMKKVPRFAFQQPDDIHVFGFTADEADRIADFARNNPELHLDWILQERGITKKWCLLELEHAGIALPAMYNLGFANNNCLGCVKATSPEYWRKTRRHFPEVFERRARLSREIGARLVRINDERRFLDELPPDEELALWTTIKPVYEDLSCGPQCGTSAGKLMYEDDLPSEIDDEEYRAWFERSVLIDGVRMGPVI